MLNDERQARVAIYYDGDCPLCRNYTNMLRLREAAGRVLLVDLRENSAAVSRFSSLNIDVNEGFVVEMDGRLYHGGEAIHALALLTAPDNLFSKIARSVFSNQRRAVSLYPWLVRGRSLLLKLIGRKMIDTSISSN